MKTRSESQPKLKAVYTSRIKDGRYSNQQSPMKNNFMTAQKPTYNAYNPESPQKGHQRPQSNHSAQAKPNKPAQNNNYQQGIDQNYNKYDYVQTQANSPVKNISHFEPDPQYSKPVPQQDFKNSYYASNSKPTAKVHQQTFYGRKLEYPHPNQPAWNYQQNDKKVNKNQNMRRAQSAATYSKSSSPTKRPTYVDRSVKSRQIKEKNASDAQKIKKAVNYLMETNGDYLAERRRVCNQKAKPREEILKIKLANTPSTYKQHYPPKDAPYEFYIQPQNQKTANSFGPRKVCGNSKNNQVHNGVQGPRADLATWPEGFKLQGPLDGTTTYANRFPDHGDFEKMVPIATFDEHPSGLKFKPNTTHKDFHKGEHCPRSDIATWNNLHPYGNQFNPDRNTTHRSNHNSKQKQPIQQWPMYDPRLIISKGKFSTQYKSEMNKWQNHELNHENYCQCGHCGHKGRKRIYN